MNSKEERLVTVLITIVGLAALVAAVFLFAIHNTHAQEKQKEYKLTEVQQLKLANYQKDAQLLQLQIQSLNTQFQTKVSLLMSEAQKVKLENGWSPDTQFDPDKLVFSAPAAKEEKKP